MIYVVWGRGSEFLKIGYTSKDHPDDRAEDYATGCPFPIVTLAFFHGNRACERRIQKQLKASRQHREWFKATPEVLAFLSKHVRHMTAEGLLWYFRRTNPHLAGLIEREPWRGRAMLHLCEAYMDPPYTRRCHD